VAEAEEAQTAVDAGTTSSPKKLIRPLSSYRWVDFRCRVRFCALARWRPDSGS